MLKRILFILLILFLAFVAIVLIRTFTFKSRQVVTEHKPAPEISSDALKHLVEAVQFKTVSNADNALFDSAAFKGFHRFLEITYPLTHQKLKREVLTGYTLLYTWEGTDTKRNPVMLMAHQDVVPVEEGTESIWTVDPFAGVVKDDFIWGRGTADDKGNLISIMEGVEKLLAENFQPTRTIYLAFGHDEEIGGTGAMAIAAKLKSKNITLDMVLDEGGIITREKVPGMQKPVALLGTSEKGFLTLELSVEKHGGHSAMPENETAIDILSAAIGKLRANPFEAKFSVPTQGFIENIGPELPFTQKMAFANLWIFKPVVIGIYEQSTGGNALIRTTIAPTILRAGMKDNVIPTVATATINFRILPGDSVSKVVEHVRQAINDDRVIIKPQAEFREATTVTSSESFAYKQVDLSIKRSFDGLVTTPFLMIAATDSRHFNEVSEGIIKFSPIIDPIGFHGIDERISLESYKTSLWFFEQLIRDLK